MNNLKFPFSYKVIWYNEIYKDPDYKFSEDCGMGLADSYADAARQIEQYYGHDLVTIKELTLYEENSLIILDENVIKKYANEEYNIIRHCNEHGEYPEGDVE